MFKSQFQKQNNTIKNNKLSKTRKHARGKWDRMVQEDTYLFV